MSHGRVARKRYKRVDHRGPVDAVGQGWITGHQNRRPAPRNVICSTVCKISKWTQSVNSTGRCHATRVNVETIKHRAGVVTVRVTWCTSGCRDMLPRTLRASRGITCQNIFIGSPNRSNGGAKVIRSKCLIMWAVSRLWSYTASGEPHAAQIRNRPRKKLPAFQAEIGTPDTE